MRFLRIAAQTLRNEDRAFTSTTFAPLSARNAEPETSSRCILNLDTFPPMKLSLKSILAGGAIAALAAFAFAAPAAENWENHCAKCHGADGKGQTKVGRKLNVKDYTNAKVQAEMKDEEIIKVTTEGVTDKNGKEKMKAYKDELSAQEIKEFVAYIRKFKT